MPSPVQIQADGLWRRYLNEGYTEDAAHKKLVKNGLLVLGDTGEWRLSDQVHEPNPVNVSSPLGIVDSISEVVPTVLGEIIEAGVAGEVRGTAELPEFGVDALSFAGAPKVMTQPIKAGLKAVDVLADTNNPDSAINRIRGQEDKSIEELDEHLIGGRKTARAAQLVAGVALAGGAYGASRRVLSKLGSIGRRMSIDFETEMAKSVDRGFSEGLAKWGSRSSSEADILAGKVLYEATGSPANLPIDSPIVPRLIVSAKRVLYNKKGEKVGNIAQEGFNASVPGNTAVKVIVSEAKIPSSIQYHNMVNKAGKPLSGKSVGDLESGKVKVLADMMRYPKVRKGTQIYTLADDGVEYVGRAVDDFQPRKPTDSLQVQKTIKKFEADTTVDKLFFKDDKGLLTPINHNRLAAEEFARTRATASMSKDLPVVPAKRPDDFEIGKVWKGDSTNNLFALGRWVSSRMGHLMANERSYPIPASRYIRGSDAKTFFRKEIAEYHDTLTGSINKAERVINVQRRQMEKAMGRAGNRLGKTPDELAREIDVALKNGTIDELPSELIKPVQEARDYIDDLSLRMHDVISSSSGPTDAEKIKHVETIRANLGKYIHLQYGKHATKNWWGVVQGTNAYDDYMSYLRIKTGDEWSEAERVAYAYRVASEKSAGFIQAFRPREARLQKFDTLLEQTLPDAVTKNFMGVVDDALLNYTDTAAKLIHDIETTSFLRRVMKRGLETGVFSTKPNLAGKRTAEFAISKIDAPVFMEEPAQKFFKEILSFEAQKRNLYYQINGLVKGGKIIPSPKTHIRNAESSVVMAIANGMVSHPIQFTKALAQSVGANIIEEYPKVAERMFSRKGIQRLVGDKKELDKLVDEMTEHNLFRQGGRAGELADYGNKFKAGLLNDPRLGSISMDTGPQNIVMRGDKVTWAEKFLDKANYYMTLKGHGVTAYHIGDDLLKGAVYSVRKQEYDWALRLKGKNFDELPEETLSIIRKEYGDEATQSLEAFSAIMTQNTMQHYSKAPRIAKMLSRHPITSPFVTFQFEMPRNLANMIRYAGVDIKMAAALDEPRLYALAAQKLAGVASAGMVAAGTADYFNSKYGIDDKFKRAFSRVGALDWDRGGKLIFPERNGPIIKYRNASYVDPYQVVWGPLETIVMGNFSQESFIEAGEQITDDYLSIEPLFKTMLETAIDRRVQANAVPDFFLRDEGDPIGSSRLNKGRIYNFTRGIAPGIIVDAMRMREAYKNPDRSMVDEIEALYKPRLNTIDIREQYAAHTRNWKKAADRLKDIKDPAERDRLWEKHLSTMRDITNDFRTIGLDYRYFLEATTGKTKYAKIKLSKKNRTMLWSGASIPYVVYAPPKPEEIF